MIESGASSHMTFERGDFCTLQSVRDGLEVFLARGDRLPVCGTRSVSFILERGRTAIINNVIYITGIDRKLRSVSALAARKADVHFKDEMCSILF